MNVVLEKTPIALYFSGGTYIWNLEHLLRGIMGIKQNNPRPQEW